MGKMLNFFKECVGELRKVVWPSRDVVVDSVKVVIISSFFVAVILGALDLLFTSGMQLIF